MGSGGGLFPSLLWLSPKTKKDSVVPVISLSFCSFPSLCYDPTLIWAQGNFITYQIKSVIDYSPSLLHGEIFPAVSDWGLPPLWHCNGLIVVRCSWFSLEQVDMIFFPHIPLYPHKFDV